LRPGASLDLRADLKARDLAATRSALVAAGIEMPPLSGNGQLAVTVKGPLRGPAVTAEGRFDRIAVADARIRGVDVQASVPNVAAPWASSLKLGVQRVRAGQTNIRGVRVALTPQEESDAFVLEVGLAGPRRLALQATARWRKPGESLTLQRFRLRYPNTTWRNRGPADIAFGKRTVVDGLRLAAEDQSLAVDLKMQGQRIDVKAELQDLDLSRLDQMTGPGFDARGRLSFAVEAHGALPLPRADVTVTARDAGFAGYGPVTADVAAKLRGRRVRGSIEAEGVGANLKTAFHMPVNWPWPARAQQVL